MIIRLDTLSRFVIPKAIREMIGVKPNDRIELKVVCKKLIITKGE